MSLVIMGASYKTAPLSTRERIAVPRPRMPECLRGLCSEEGVREAAVLSTCNRVEILLEAQTDRIGAEVCAAHFGNALGDDFDEDEFYLYRGVDAVRHLFRVVCSLDSQVLGEAQILGQVKRCYGDADEAGTCKEVLTKLLKMAIHLGKRVRSETCIGSDSVSLSTTALKVARENVDDLKGARIVLVGAGEMARLTATYLLDAGASDITVTSRNFSHARMLASEFGARAVPFVERYAVLAQADLAFMMTSAPGVVVGSIGLARALAAADREERPLVIVDEAVPRDVDYACGALDEVRLFDQEALAAIADDGLAQRMRAVAEVERMVQEAEAEFLSWQQERLVAPTVKDIYRKGALVQQGEFERACHELEKALGTQLSDEARAVLDAYGNAIVKKLLHGPVRRLKKEAGDADSYYYTGAARFLFGLDTLPPGTHHRCKKRACERDGSSSCAGGAGKERS